jgi:hypothetical protein
MKSCLRFLLRQDFHRRYSGEFLIKQIIPPFLPGVGWKPWFILAEEGLGL